MHAAMHVRVVLQVIAGDRVDHRARLLAGRRAVEVDQRLAADPLLEDGEVLPHPLDVQPRCTGAQWLAQRRHAASFSLSHSGSFEVTNSLTRARRGSSGMRFTISLAKA